MIEFYLVEAAKANGLDPHGYLFFILSLLPSFEKSPVHEKPETLMPGDRKIQKRYNPNYKENI